MMMMMMTMNTVEMSANKRTKGKDFNIDVFYKEKAN